ncbi:MAG: peptide chain release factor 1, partial [Candidatus Methanoperedens sp.]|nr:peptide chain release factor 1 [Candidatus Methanoperedens sp.]
MVESEAHKKYEFKRTLEVLRNRRGRGTELISLYIPHDKQIHEVAAQLREEFGQASN